MRPPSMWPGLILLLAVPFVCLPVASARADIIRTSTSVMFTGSINNSAGPVTVAATFWVESGQPDTLNLLLQNTSTATTPISAGLLTGLYFGVYSGTTGGTAPPLTYLSALGQVYEMTTTGTNIPGVWHPPVILNESGTFTAYEAGLSDLRALQKKAQTWEFRDNLSLTLGPPTLNFGVGTAGYNSLSPDNFNGDLVDGNDFGIFAGNPDSSSVAAAKWAVSGSATFQFGGFSGFTVAQIPDSVVFGLGTAPDLIIQVPEPGTIALALAGAGAILGVRLRRRSPGRRTMLRSTAAAVIAGAASVGLLFAVPARAVPVQDWDFSTGANGWTSETFTVLSPTTPVSGSYWDYWQPGSAAAPYWHVTPTRSVGGWPNWITNCLTSPVITVPQNVDALDFSIRQRFNFPVDISTGNPLVIGQVGWRFYNASNPNAAFQPFTPLTFTTGTVPPPFKAYSPYPNWVPNNYTVGTFGVPPLLATGGAWTGASPGWASGDFVMTQVVLDGGLKTGQQVQFRFINAIVGVQCTGSEWDVARITVIGQLPEPGSLSLATLGGCSAALGLLLRDRLTNGLRARS